MGRPFVGLQINFMNAQTGAKGSVKPVRGDEEKRLLRGQSSFNCFEEKSKVIANITPQMAEPSGEVVDLQPGDPENVDIVVNYYEVIYDGKRYRGDAIGETPIELNNHDANLGMTMRLVFGPGIEGNHTLGFAASVNGHVAETAHLLKLNG